VTVTVPTLLMTVTVTVAVAVAVAGLVGHVTGTEVVMTWIELVLVLVLELVGGAGLHFPFKAVP